MGPGQRHTIGTVTVNGVKMKALFDTGAPSLMLTLAAAKRIGLTPDSPGVTPSGAAAGLGSHFVRAWRARLDSIDIGGETITHPWVEIADQSLQSSDMLIGVDFLELLRWLLRAHPSARFAQQPCNPTANTPYRVAPPPLRCRQLRSVP